MGSRYLSDIYKGINLPYPEKCLRIYSWCWVCFTGEITMIQVLFIHWKKRKSSSTSLYRNRLYQPGNGDSWNWYFGIESLWKDIGHALGLYHEQSRYDRDNYIDILVDNIQSSYLGQFSRQGIKMMVDFGVGYDYGSVMHYDQSVWRCYYFYMVNL